MTHQLLAFAPDVEESQRPRVIDRFDPRLVAVLTTLGLVLPVAAYFWLVHRFSVNVIFGDQWSDVTVINHVTWGTLWAQHNENRIFFPNLIVLLLAHTTHFNIVIEEYLSALILVAAVFLLAWAHQRRSSMPWLYYCPFVMLAFSFVQAGNTLWGFQIAWYLVLLALAVAIVLIDWPKFTWFFLGCAVAAGVVGSFSSVQGLLIWPAGLILLYHRRRIWPFVVAWLAASVATTFIYFYGYKSTGERAGLAWTLHHPVAAIKFYVFALGDVTGIPYQAGIPGALVWVFGIVILALAVLALILYGIRRDETSGAPIGITLICVGLLFTLLITVGRFFYGYGLGAGASRYTTFDLLVPLGIYLTLLERPGVTVPNVLPVARIATATVFVLLIVMGYHYGYNVAQGGYRYQTKAARVLRNIDHEPIAAEFDLQPYDSPAYLRHQAQIAESRHLSLFDQSPG